MKEPIKAYFYFESILRWGIPSIRFMVQKSWTSWFVGSSSLWFTRFYASQTVVVWDFWTINSRSTQNQRSEVDHWWLYWVLLGRFSRGIRLPGEGVGDGVRLGKLGAKTEKKYRKVYLDICFGGPNTFSGGVWMSRDSVLHCLWWWFQIFVHVHPDLGKISNVD